VISAGVNYIDPQALMRIRNLELRARAVVEGFWHGLHRSPYHGFSVEFTEYRPYVSGDDTRYLDWKLLARTDRFFIKKFEDETNLRCHLLVDISQSMGYGSLPYTKAQYATTLAATLAYFLDQQGDAVGLFTFDQAVREYLPARHRPGHLRNLMLALEKTGTGRVTDLTAPLQRAAALLRKRGVVVLLSDFLAPLEAVESSLGLLTASGHEVLIFQILDPAELTFSFEQPARFRDLEAGRELFLEPALARPEYLRRLGSHLDSLRGICERLGAGYHQFTSERPLEEALFQFLKKRESRGRRVARRAQARGTGL
jgi:uncharacterized protein (DUF58 family)